MFKFFFLNISLLSDVKTQLLKFHQIPLVRIHWLWPFSLHPTVQHIHKPSHVCQPVGECLYQLPLFLLVDIQGAQGLLCKCAGQAFAKGNFVPPFCRFLSYIFLQSTEFVVNVFYIGAFWAHPPAELIFLTYILVHKLGLQCHTRVQLWVGVG